MKNGIARLMFLRSAMLFVVSITGNLLADTIQLTGYGEPYVSQTGVYRVHRDFFGNGGHEWRQLAPTGGPFGLSNYTTGSDPVSFDLTNMLLDGATIESATLNWSFSNLQAPTPFASVGLGFFWPQLADIPRVHGSRTPCGLCIPAALKYFAPGYNFYADHLTLEGVSSYALASSSSAFGVASGAVDLLSIWSSDELATHRLEFVGSVIYHLGHPFFDGEGRNADTEFDVSGYTRASQTATLTVHSSVPPPPPPEVPEPASLLLLGTGLLGIGWQWRKRQQNRKKNVV